MEASMRLSLKVPLLLLLLLLLASVAVHAQEAPAPAPTMESGSVPAGPGLCVLALSAVASLVAAFAH